MPDKHALDKHKVSLDVVLEQTRVMPGDTVSGIVLLTVKEQVEITAVRVRIAGVEKGKLRRQRRITRRPAYLANRERQDHYQQVITLAGFSSADNRSGGFILSPGALQYSFSVVLPANAPPSRKARMTFAKDVVSYSVTAMVVIPRGFDKEKKIELVVLPSVTKQQYQSLRAKTVNVGRTVSVVKGMLGTTHRGSTVVLEATAQPAVLLLKANNFAAADVDPSSSSDSNSNSSCGSCGSGSGSTDCRKACRDSGDTKEAGPYTDNTLGDSTDALSRPGCSAEEFGGPDVDDSEVERRRQAALVSEDASTFSQPAPNTHTLKVLVNVRNESPKDVVETVRVRLNLVQIVHVSRFFREDTKTLAQVKYTPLVPISPGQTRSFVVLLEVPPSPAPWRDACLQTCFGETYTEIVVDTNKLRIRNPLRLKEPVLLTSAVDDVRCAVPRQPYMYADSLILPEMSPFAPMAGSPTQQLAQRRDSDCCGEDSAKQLSWASDSKPGRE